MDVATGAETGFLTPQPITSTLGRNGKPQGWSMRRHEENALARWEYILGRGKRHR